MTVYVQFAPTPEGPFQFSATLDAGETYNCTVTWNIYGQRWYLNLYTQNFVQIFCRALIASPPDYDISLTGGYFTTAIIYRDTTQTFEVG